jgi:membrane-associated protease RseP (regulator of RpoE activity)
MQNCAKGDTDLKTCILMVLAAIAIAGCATNGFEKFYQPAQIAPTAHIQPFSGEPAIYTYSDNPKADVVHAQENGYIKIGYASFYGPDRVMTRDQLVAQAKRVGAAMVLVHSQYKDTLSGVVPYTVANPMQVSTVNTNGTVNANGPGGNVTGTYSGQSTVMTPGGTTTYAIPYAVNRNDTVATFWARQDPRSIRLGVLYESLSDDLRAKLQRNSGVVAVGIAKGSPAFAANILKGDVILKIGGEDVIDREGFAEQLKRFAGQGVDLGILRGDAAKTIHVTLNQGM